MKKVLVTGGGGFIGSNIALALQKEGLAVTVVDDFSHANSRNLADFSGDVVRESILEVSEHYFRGVDAIFHQAAITDTTVRDEDLMMGVNVEGSRRLLDFAVKSHTPFIYASSAAVYGNRPAPLREEMAGSPLNLYGLSKWKTDLLAREAMNSSSLIVGLRYFNVFGPHEAHKGKMASMVWQLALQMKAGQRPRIFKWGEQKRDQVYIKDVVLANLLAVKAKRSGIVNVGSGRATSFNQIVQALNKVLGTALEPEYIDNPYREAYQNHTQADLTLARSLLQYKPVWRLMSAVKDYMEVVKVKGRIFAGTESV